MKLERRLLGIVAALFVGILLVGIVFIAGVGIVRGRVRDWGQGKRGRSRIRVRAGEGDGLGVEEEMLGLGLGLGGILALDW